MSVEKYEIELAAWKARHGVVTGDDGEIDGEAMMIADDAKRKGKDYCVECGNRFRIADMRLISRRDDPYIQYDEEQPDNRPDWYIKVGHRVRACLPCFKAKYESEDET